MWTYNATYESFDGETIKEKFYFNLSKAELTEMEISSGEGYSGYLQKIIDTKDRKELVATFKKLIDMSYGVKADDGKKFYKNAEALADFHATNAYSNLFCELATDSKLAAEFLINVLPKDIVSKLKETGKFDEAIAADGN